MNVLSKLFKKDLNPILEDAKYGGKVTLRAFKYLGFLYFVSEYLVNTVNVSTFGLSKCSKLSLFKSLLAPPCFPRSMWREMWCCWTN